MKPKKSTFVKYCYAAICNKNHNDLDSNIYQLTATSPIDKDCLGRWKKKRKKKKEKIQEY